MPEQRGKFKVAVVGATGAVGSRMLDILEQRRFPVGELVPFASEKSLGRKIPWSGTEWNCQILKPGCFKGIDIVFFDVSDELSREWVPRALEEGAWVVDNSAIYRLDPNVPLVVPEVNGSLIQELVFQAKNGKAKRLIAGPNCTTAQLVLPLQAIHQKFSLSRVSVSTYQSVSGAGAGGSRELLELTRSYEENRAEHARIFAHTIAFNCLPQIGKFGEGGFTSEELKVIAETRRILGLPGLRITCTAVRVPTLNCHGESVQIELNQSATLSQILDCLKGFPGIQLLGENDPREYPLFRDPGVQKRPKESWGQDCRFGDGRDPVLVGRVRVDPSVEKGFQFWVVADNLRKGAALNAIQIAEILQDGIRS